VKLVLMVMGHAWHVTQLTAVLSGSEEEESFPSVCMYVTRSRRFPTALLVYCTSTML
jgi:hypothetical protein